MVATLSRVFCSALELAEGAPLPAEFLLFRAGPNETSKGVFVFDAAAATAVLAHYKREGVDLMVDCEHDSLSDKARAMRSDAGDALGWYQLELRVDGSLWASNVRWNAEGERRLRAKTQRYISPAFTVTEGDDGAMRVSAVINAALTAIPATHSAPALVAASRLKFPPPRSARLLNALNLAARVRAANVISYRNGKR